MQDFTDFRGLHYVSGLQPLPHRFYFGKVAMMSRVLPKTVYLFDCQRATAWLL